jgi:hypothetical protein
MGCKGNGLLAALKTQKCGLMQRYGILDPDETIEPTREETCRQALEQLARVQIAWNGKPIADRNRLYDEARSESRPRGN